MNQYIKNRAFKSFLVSMNIEESVQYMFECMRDPSGQMAWELMEEAHGANWKIGPEGIAATLAEAVLLAHKQIKETL